MISRKWTLMTIATLGLAVAGVFILSLARTPSGPVTVRIGVEPTLACAQVFVAHELGFFRDEGLEAEIFLMQDAMPTLLLLSSGRYDVAFADLESLLDFRGDVSFQATAGGVSIDATHGSSGVVVLQGSEVQDIRQLQRKRVGVDRRRGVLEVSFRRAWSQSNPGDTFYQFVEIPFKEMEAALRAKEIDVAIMVEPYLSAVTAGGGVLNLGDPAILAMGEAVTHGYFANSRFAAAHPDTMRKFNRAMQRATAVANSYDDRTITVVSRISGIPAKVTKAAGRPRFLVALPGTAISAAQGWRQTERSSASRPGPPDVK